MVAAAGPRSDTELVEAVRAGDTQAFAELYRRHAGAVRVVAASQIRDREAVADVVQDSFLRALRSLRSLQDPSRFRPWLLSIARNLATDHLRACSRVTVLDDSAAQDLPESGLGPAALAELRELAEQVQGCVSGLSRRDATAVALVTQLGFAPEQVARALDMTRGAAKVLLHRARRRMRHALVLQVMVRQPELACDELRSLVTADPVAAARHVESCQTCIAVAATEVMTLRLTEPAMVNLTGDLGPGTAPAAPATTETVAP